jgi:hypothetical protein
MKSLCTNTTKIQMFQFQRLQNHSNSLSRLSSLSSIAEWIKSWTKVLSCHQAPKSQRLSQQKPELDSSTVKSVPKVLKHSSALSCLKRDRIKLHQSIVQFSTSIKLELEVKQLSNLRSLYSMQRQNPVIATKCNQATSSV